jgi:ribonucleoside-diphosphate reductase alpha chain
MHELIYLNDDIDSTVERILSDEELERCGLGKRKVLRTLKSFQGDEIATSVFLKKYALRDDDNKVIEFTLDEAKDRWSKTIASAEPMFNNDKCEDVFPDTFVNYFRELYEYLLPAGRQMYALGNSSVSNATYTNCYVTKIEEDSLEGIYDAARKLARTYSYGGGIGLCIGELRPANAKVSNSARFSTGAASFMELYSSTTGLIGQHGRRGALMITIPVTHPDIERFIEIKRNQDQVQYANISVKLTDEFMNAVVDNKDIELFFKTHHEEYREVVNARSLWKKIIESAHGFAEPGLLFWDRMVEMSPSDTYDRLKVHSTNPCGEQILEPGGACVLSSLLLHKFVKNPFTENAEFDFELFKEMVTRGVRHLDNVVELNINRHGLKEQIEAAKVGRRVGLGVTGLADMYAAMCIRYDSQEALGLADKIMEAKKIAEYTASIYLAKERGSFPIFDAKKHFSRGFCKTLPKEIVELAKKYGLRNVALSTVAPSGSLSIIAQCSGGIEPIYAFSYSRFVELGRGRKEFKIYHQGLSRFFSVKEDDEYDFNTDLSDIPEYWVAAHQIDYKYRVRLQGVLQKHIDASISSTINLPEDTPVKVVSDIYMAAWREGLKGVTVYREGSREGVLITEEFAKAAGTPDMNTVIRCVRAEGGDKFYIMVSYKDKDIKSPYQVFVLNYKKTDSDSFIKISNALIRMLASRGVPDKRIQKYIDRSKNSLAKLTRFLSLSMKTNNLDGAVEVLEEHSFAGSLAARLYNILSESLEMRKAMCKKCRSSNVRMEEGCMRCLDCNWSGCN